MPKMKVDMQNCLIQPGWTSHGTPIDSRVQDMTTEKSNFNVEQEPQSMQAMHRWIDIGLHVYFDLSKKGYKNA